MVILIEFRTFKRGTKTQWIYIYINIVHLKKSFYSYLVSNPWNLTSDVYKLPLYHRDSLNIVVLLNYYKLQVKVLNSRYQNVIFSALNIFALRILGEAIQPVISPSRGGGRAQSRNFFSRMKFTTQRWEKCEFFRYILKCMNSERTFLFMSLLFDFYICGCYIIPLCARGLRAQVRRKAAGTRASVYTEWFISGPEGFITKLWGKWP